MRLPVLCLVVVSALLCPPSRAQVPVFQVTPIQSSIRFNMGSSRALTGNFDKWHSSLTFASPDPTSAALQVEIQTASVHSGNNKNDDELKSKDLLNVAQDPVISFKSNKVVQTGKTTYDLVGTFSLRGVTKPATLNLVIADQGGGLRIHPGSRTLRPYELRYDQQPEDRRARRGRSQPQSEAGERTPN